MNELKRVPTRGAAIALAGNETNTFASGDIGTAYDFSMLDFSGLDLSSVRFLKGSKFVGSNFSGCNLSRAIFTECNLSLCDFSGANLGETRLNGSNIAGATFESATMDKTWLTGCRVGGFNLKPPNFDATAYALPTIENIHTAVYLASNGRLDMSKWTMGDDAREDDGMSRSGWVVHVAGLDKLMPWIEPYQLATMLYQKNDAHGLLMLEEPHELSVMDTADAAHAIHAAMQAEQAANRLKPG